MIRRPTSSMPPLRRRRARWRQRRRPSLCAACCSATSAGELRRRSSCRSRCSSVSVNSDLLTSMCSPVGEQLLLTLRRQSGHRVLEIPQVVRHHAHRPRS
jgi:hypothetical protein